MAEISDGRMTKMMLGSSSSKPVHDAAFIPSMV